MTMTDSRNAREHALARAGYGKAAHVDKARTFLVGTGHYMESEVMYSNAVRIARMMDQLYTGGWEQFLTDTVTVEQALLDATSEAEKWELSW